MWIINCFVNGILKKKFWLELSFVDVEPYIRKGSIAIYSGEEILRVGAYPQS